MKKFNFKHVFLIVLTMFICSNINAQVKVGDNPATIDARSVLDIESTTKGVLLPRLTTAQRDAQTGWKAASFIYNSTDNCIQYFDGTKWDCLTSLGKIGAALNTTPSPLVDSLAKAVVKSPVSDSIATLEPWFNNSTMKGSMSVDSQIYHNGSVNIGTGTSATKGNLTVGLGHAVIGTGTNNIVAGQDQKNVSGNNNIVSGNANDSISGQNSIIVGNDNKNISANSSAIFGAKNAATGDVNLVCGSTNNVSNYLNFVGGSNNVLNGTTSFLYGTSNTNIGGALNFVFGQGIKNVSEYLNIIGGAAHDSISSRYSIINGNSNSKISCGSSLVIGNQNNNLSGVANIYAGTANKNISELYNSVVAGTRSETISGFNSLVVGDSFNKLSINDCIISGLGTNNITSFGSIICGEKNSFVTGADNLVVGKLNSNISGYYSIVSGVQNDSITGDYNLVVGYLNKNVSGTGNIVGGSSNPNTKGSNCLVIGTSNQVDAAVLNSSIISGTGLTASASNTAYAQNLTVMGTFTNSSDARLKTNINSLSYGLNEVLKMRPAIYNYKKDMASKSMGFIAQEMQTIIPEAVDVVDKTTGYLGINYVELIPVLTKAIQELNSKLAASQSENSELKAELTKTINKIDQVNAEKSREIELIKAALSSNGIDIKSAHK